MRIETRERTLSKNESRLILEMEWRHQNVISLDEIQSALAASEGYARFVAHRLVRKGWFERLRRGVYQLIPAERGREGVGDTNPFVDVAMLDTPAFYSFGTACSFYGLTDQAFADMYLATSKRRPPAEIRGKKYVFAYFPPKRFFGFEKVDVFGQPTQMALSERAILDALDRPEYAGGLPEVSRIIRRAAPKLDFARLVEFAGKWSQSAVVQRLGFLLDLHQIPLPSEVRAGLKALVKPHNKVHLAPRGRSKGPARFSSEWRVVENIPRAHLVESTGGRRPFVPRKRAGENST